MRRLLTLCGFLLALFSCLLKAYGTFPGPLRWKNVPDTNPMMPRVVKYYINYKGTPDCEGEFEAVQKAFQTWQKISTARISFNYFGTTSKMPSLVPYGGDDYNVVGWIESGWTSIDPEFHTSDGARTVFWFDAGNQIFEFEMFFNGEQPYPWSANVAPTCPSGRVDVENIGAHEAGHVIGLEHDSIFPRDTAETMYPSDWCGLVARRTLEPDDIAGASYLYPYPATWAFGEPAPLYRIEEHNFNSDIALVWNPIDGAGNYKSEYIHGACQESQYTSIASESFVPLDSVIWPVCVVYGNNGTAGWSYREHLSAYHNSIFGPELEIDKDDKCHIIWTECDDSMGNVIYRKRENGLWGPSIDLSGTVRNPRYPVIAVQHWPSATSPHGSNIYVAWLEERRAQDGSYKPCIMFKRNVNGSWLQSELLVGPGNFYLPQLALDSTGGVHLVWTGSIAGASCIFWAKNTNLGNAASWCPTKWKNVEINDAPSIAIDGYGYVHILYVSNLGSNDKRVEYSSIYNLGTGATNWDTTGWDLGYISPANVRAGWPRVICDNMGFTHFFWSDNRYHAGQYKFDAFYRRNYRVGAPADWDTATHDIEGRPGKKIYLTQLDGNYFLAGVAQSDSLGNVAVVTDVWTQIYQDYDVFGNCFRQDDTIRPWPDPFNNPSSSPLAAREIENPVIRNQDCYISGSVNQLAYFAPTECRLSYFSIDGRLVKTENVNGAGVMRPAGLPSGVYFARIQSGDGTSKQAKVVIVN